MTSKLCITRSTARWLGIALLVLGVVTAAIAIWGSVRANRTHRNAEAMAKDLRAKGAIVENYYKVLPRTEPPAFSPLRTASYFIAGVLVAGGAVVIGKTSARPKAPH